MKNVGKKLIQFGGILSIIWGMLFLVNSPPSVVLVFLLAFLASLPSFLIIIGVLIMLWAKVLSLEEKLNGK